MIEKIKETIKHISEKHNADVYLFSATVNDKTADRFIQMIKHNSKKKENCYLILTTNGGDPDAGYRMTRLIKRKYEKFILCVLGSCKSTGTLIALGADHIIMGDFGEFGPLDIQLTKDDEMSNTSGLSYLQSLNSLNEQAFTSFETSFMRLKRRSGYTITTKTAAEIATKVSVGIISPISAQIDPVKLGEVQRAIKIADAYGKRLNENNDLLNRLIAGFPSHSFVIDFEECKHLFGENNVTYATEDELVIEHVFFNIVRQETEDDMINNLVEQFEDKQLENEVDNKEKKNKDGEKVEENNKGVSKVKEKNKTNNLEDLLTKKN